MLESTNESLLNWILDLWQAKKRLNLPLLYQTVLKLVDLGDSRMWRFHLAWKLEQFLVHNDIWNWKKEEMRFLQKILKLVPFTKHTLIWPPKTIHCNSAQTNRWWLWLLYFLICNWSIFIILSSYWMTRGPNGTCYITPLVETDDWNSQRMRFCFDLMPNTCEKLVLLLRKDLFISFYGWKERVLIF